MKYCDIENKIGKCGALFYLSASMTDATLYGQVKQQPSRLRELAL